MPDHRWQFAIGAAVLLTTALIVAQVAAFRVVDQDCFGGGFGDQSLRRRGVHARRLQVSRALASIPPGRLVHFVPVDALTLRG
jgi:hypothetical protein